MTLLDRLSLLRPLDGFALIVLVASWAIIGWVIENPPSNRPSVSSLMDKYRKDWMVQLVERETRIFDAQILVSLRQGTAFFASTCILAIGGALALAGNTAPLAGLASELGDQMVPDIVFQLKLGAVVLFLTHAFLKFAWANRMFGYFSVLVAAIPNDPRDPTALEIADRAGELCMRATKNFNRGLRSIYFALGTLAWLFGATALLIATVVTVAVLWEREFMSGGRQSLLNKPPTM